MWTSVSPCTKAAEAGFPNAMFNLGRGLHSFSSQLNVSAFYGIGGAGGGCVARVKGVLRGCRVFLCVRHGSR